MQLSLDNKIQKWLLTNKFNNKDGCHLHKQQFSEQQQIKKDKPDDGC